MSTLAPERIVRAGFAPALPFHVLLDFTRELRLRVPDVAVQVAHLLSLEQLTRLRSGELDLAIVVDPGQHPDLELQPLVAGELLAACLPADHRLAGRQVVRPADVCDETLVCLGKSINPAVFERTLERFAAVGYRFARIEEAAGETARDIVLAVASSRGIALLPGSLEELSDATHDVVLRPLDPPLRMPLTAVAWRADAGAALTPILDAVRAVARELFEAVDCDPGPAGTNSDRRHAPGVLTARQLDVLRLLADGRSTHEIAAELGLSQATVRNYVAGLMAALGVHTRLQAVIAGQRAGLLDR